MSTQNQLFRVSKICQQSLFNMLITNDEFEQLVDISSGNNLFNCPLLRSINDISRFLRSMLSHLSKGNTFFLKRRKLLEIDYID